MSLQFRICMTNQLLIVFLWHAICCKWFSQKDACLFFFFCSFFSSAIHFFPFPQYTYSKTCYKNWDEWTAQSTVDPSQEIQKYSLFHNEASRMRIQDIIARLLRQSEGYMITENYSLGALGILSSKFYCDTSQVISKCMDGCNRKNSHWTKCKCGSCSATKRLIALSCMISICFFFAVLHHLKWKQFRLCNVYVLLGKLW